jgi:hypothetical protein
MFCLAVSFGMIDKHVVAHEAKKPVGVSVWLDSAEQKFVLAEEPSFADVFRLFVEVPQLEVVNNTDMVDPLSVCAHKLMAVELIINRFTVLSQV